MSFFTQKAIITVVKVSVACFLAIWFFTLNMKAGLAIETEKSIVIQIDASSGELSVGQKLLVSILINNGDKKVVEVFEPTVLQTIEAQLTKGGKVFRPQSKASLPIPRKIKLAWGKPLKVQFDLSSLFPFPMESGDYELRVVYDYAVKAQAVSNTIPIRVKPLTEKEKEALDAAFGVFRAGEYTTVAQFGQEFLEKYPNSPFSNQVRLETASALTRIGKHDESIALYKRVIESDEPREWVRQNAQGYLWQTYADKGDTQAAIAVLEKIGGSYAKDNIAFVKRLNGQSLFKKLPPDWDKVEPTGESINQMDAPDDKVAQSQLVESLWKKWIQEALQKEGDSSDSSSIFRLESFNAFRRQGAKAVKYAIDKIDKQNLKEDLGPLFEEGIVQMALLGSTSRTGFHFQSVATPENPKWTVYRCEEFPTMEIGRRAGQERELWLKWWAEKDKKIPIWFRGRYQMWQAAKKSGDKAKTEAAFDKLVDLGIFALPQWMEKLQTDKSNQKAIIAAISELTSSEVAPDATLAQVKTYWQKNKDKWTQSQPE